MTLENDLAEACAQWQSGRDGGSSRLRGAARVHTGIPHYFAADFITGHEVAARNDPTTLKHAAAILTVLQESPALTASEWSSNTGLPNAGFAGRGLKKNEPHDEVIEQRLDRGTIDMPLWGLSLSRSIADSYGGRFLFEVVGAFPAIPAWIASGVKSHEQELIAGGRYRVENIERIDGLTHAQLTWVDHLTSRH